MAVSPRDLLQMARQLMSEDKEINYRTAANRAYYSAFHCCRPLAESLPQAPTRKKGSHDRLIERLKHHPIKKVSLGRDEKIRTLGFLWGRCKSLRTRADYRIGGEFNRNKAEDLIEMAVQIHGTITEIERN